MLVHAPKEHSRDQTPPPKHANNHGLFKKSHTCGSLYAKCACNYGNSKDSHSFSEEQRLQTKSNPTTPSDQYTYQSTKRFSSPDINHHRRVSQVCLCPKSCSRSSNIIRANIYLDHPEINFPIPVELPKDYQSKSLPLILHPELKERLSLDHSSPADDQNSSPTRQKFLQDFGIIPQMGNGFGPTKKHSGCSLDAGTIQRIRRNSGEPEKNEYWRNLVRKLKNDVAEVEGKYEAVQAEVFELRKQVGAKEAQVMRLQREVHKLKCVLQQTNAARDGELLASIQKQHAMANRVPQSQTNNSKKQGVSAESSECTGDGGNIPITKYDKDFRSKQLIKQAILDNDFLKNMDTCQVREMVDCMHPKEFSAGSLVITEGEAGGALFVSARGELEVIKDGKVLGHMGPGKAFGELAILYNCTRTASIRAVDNVKVWILDRKVFQQIMMRTGLQRLQDNINFLKSVPLLQNLNNDVLAKIADVLEVEFYPAGVHIVRQGASGDTFYIISSGSVKVTQRPPSRMEEEEIRVLHRGDYFGEQALLKEDLRTASVISVCPGVECLTLDRKHFKQLIGDISEIREKDYGDEERLNKPSSSSEQQEYEYITLDDLEVVATLGLGGFGRVELVQYTKDPSFTFALKCLKKQHIVDTQQQEHIYSERSIMMGCRSPFICRLYRTYRDSKYVYMLLEACLGGEVWTILRDRSCFDDNITRFIVGCVIEAFDYLHSRGIIYRDLKPENLLLDARGYVKLTDFGFSKRLGYSSKTWTFCGTPDYVAPETILNKGHDKAVDFWALGILMHELLTGSPPFTADDPMKTYNLILKGIDMIDFAKHNVGRTAQSLIKRLCSHCPSERLGCQRGGIQDIRKHRWFQGFDWDGLVARTLPPPIHHPVISPCDTSNFDTFDKDDDVPPDELSNWDHNF
ncbi:unnamed protein product [Phaedon cochleariae]|uniref:cGMP-dependent protein kinase n=1 Tax=Phaedon cochleariae TaxID=80249 RepID=A0A9P0GIT1_PHACE|nr:unnamed protein product [Phaedon cochleariae]